MPIEGVSSRLVLKTISESKFDMNAHVKMKSLEENSALNVYYAPAIVCCFYVVVCKYVYYRMYLYVHVCIRMYAYDTRMILVYTLSLCYSYVLVWCFSHNLVKFPNNYSLKGL